MTGPRREDVRSYPRPPALEPVPQRIAIDLGGTAVARSTRALRVLETHHAPTYYLPPEDVCAVLRPVPGTSFCEWKGVASYFDVTAGGVTARRAAWRYDDPAGHFAPLAGYLGFYAGLMETCWVGDMRVLPQPGDFYGGCPEQPPQPGAVSWGRDPAATTEGEADSEARQTCRRQHRPDRRLRSLPRLLPRALPRLLPLTAIYSASPEWRCISL